MKMTQVKAKGTTYLDTVKRKYTNRVTSASGDIDGYLMGDEEGTVPEGAVKMFGTGYTPNE